MNKEFIPYNQALALKELGFDEPCFGSYVKLTETQNTFFMNDVVSEIDRETPLHKSLITKAPLYQQAFSFFRGKYNIHAEITWSPSYEYDSGEWSDAIYEITFVDVSYIKEWKAESPNMQRSGGKQLTYEEAEQECLNKLIEIIKNK